MRLVLIIIMLVGVLAALNDIQKSLNKMNKIERNTNLRLYLIEKALK